MAAFALAPAWVLADEGVGIGLRSDAVAETGLDNPHYYPRANYVWPYASGPYYGKAGVAQRWEAGVLVTSVGSFRLDAGSLPFPSALRTQNKLGREAHQYFIVQLTPGAVTRSDRATLVRTVFQQGGAVLRKLPVAAYVMRLTPAAHAFVQDAPGVMAVEPYHAAFKLDPHIGRTPLVDRRMALSETYNLDILLHRGENPELVAAAIQQMGGQVTRVWEDRVFASVHQSKLTDVAQLEPVFQIFEHIPARPSGQETTNAIQTGAINLNANPFHDAGIRGAGQVLMVLDQGVALDAMDLSDTATSSGSPGLAHRKVVTYQRTNGYGGSGDFLHCDDRKQGGWTHGHFVAAAALGNPCFSGVGCAQGTDQAGNRWDLIGVAPDAKLAFYDGLITPAIGSCGDPTLGTIDQGDLFIAPSGGSMGDAYSNYGARVVNFSWGNQVNTYGTDAQDVDSFLLTNPDALVVVPVGNQGQDVNQDNVPDRGSINDIATTKNGVAVGASAAADDQINRQRVDIRLPFSGVGPAGAFDRVAPLVTAPGGERFLNLTGMGSEYACSSGDNDNSAPVLCDQATSKGGSSFASAAVSGAALLTRDYFALGFYPDGTDGNVSNDADKVPNVSGALLKAVLVSSAHFLGIDYTGQRAGNADQLTDRWRFNYEQGYGRVQLDNALPLENWAGSPTGLIVADVATPGGANDLPGLAVIDAELGETQTTTFDVCDDTQELRVALAWMDDVGDALVNDLDLEIISPSGKLYYGNYFSDDDNRDGAVDVVTENCPTKFNDGTPGDNGWDRSEWSLETCVRVDASLSPHDGLTHPAGWANPTEAIFLSPNPENTFDPDTNEPLNRKGFCSITDDQDCGYDAQCPTGETCEGGVSQVESGTWTLKVIAKATPTGNATQTYAVVVTGGVCMDSSVSLNSTSYVCNDNATITVNERNEASDPAGGLTVAEVAARTTVEVIDGTGVVRDTELGSILGFTQPDTNDLQFVAENVAVTDGTGYDPGNGVLDVRNGDTIRVTYADQTAGVADPDKVRISTSTAGCQVDIVFGNVVYQRFGMDIPVVLNGGCERNARGEFYFGFPDQYMDAGEAIVYQVGFASLEQDDLTQAVAELSCVLADADSPAGCAPGSTDCADPDRLNNPPCTQLSIVDPVQGIGLLTPNSTLGLRFQVLVASAISGTPEVDMLLKITGQASGKSASTLIANRHTLNVDEVSAYYNTDYPLGGVEITDLNNNGLIENPTNTGQAGFPTSTNTDYKFETMVYSDLTDCKDATGASVVCNTGLNSPWNFDTNDGGFTTGLTSPSNDQEIAETIAQWGEDKNFNNQLDGRCQASPSRACNRFDNDPVNCGALCPECFGDDICINLEDRDPENSPLPQLDQSWSTEGGCGWQTKAPATCSDDPDQGCYTDADCAAGTCGPPAPPAGGIWHTGRISNTTNINCMFAGNDPGQCQFYETIGGTTGQLRRDEILMGPVIEKVNQSLLPDGRNQAIIEITAYEWNETADLPDNNASWRWEIDTNIDQLEPTDLVADNIYIGNLIGGNSNGPWGAVTNRNNQNLTSGYNVFALLDAETGTSKNGVVGGNRAAKNSCFFENGAVLPENYWKLGYARPIDDDRNEGYCPSGQGLGDNKPATKFCTTVCAGSVETTCSVDNDCVGTCINPGDTGFCNNEPTKLCADDAACNLGTCVDVVCNGTCSGGACTNSGDVCTTDADCTEACVFTNTTVDEYVSPTGPSRNRELNDWNGPDMRVNTLEDLYGPTGNRFQGAVGFVNFESQTTSEAEAGFGLAIDDIVIAWREYTLEEDITDCVADGACATIFIQANLIYEGNAVIDVTVVDTTPSANDCNWDGVQDGTRDCNGNGKDDVPVEIKWTGNQDPTVRLRVFLDTVGGGVYKGSYPISSSYDVPGTVFVAPQGNLNPVVQAEYYDWDDGSGQPCKNNVGEQLWGKQQATTTVLLTPLNVVVTRSALSDNRDNDGWADDFETVSMRVEVSNKSGQDLTGVSLRLSSNDPNIACITLPFLDFGDLADAESRFSDEAFEFIMGDIGRTDEFADIAARVQVSIDADQFDATNLAQELLFDLDLDATGGSGPSVFFEGFEGGFGAFTTMHLDETLNPPPDDISNHPLGRLAADGWRCQYSDPDWVNASSYGSSQAPVCYPSPNGAPDRFWWNVTDNRAFSGAQSMYFGQIVEGRLTSPVCQLEAIRTTEPVNLGWDKVCEIDRLQTCNVDGDCASGQRCVNAKPELSFKHQISLLDHRTVNAQTDRSADRAMMHLQIADNDGNPVGDWLKLQPFTNVYDSQSNSNYFNCTFDPADDGNDEGSFFDPTDPNRRFGPSSMCSPAFAFTYQGDTERFDQGAIGKASDGPGLAGISGTGTWVEPRYDLDRFRGRRLRLRYIFSGLKLGGVVVWDNAFSSDVGPRDDGWFIDDVTLTDTLQVPASVSADLKDNSFLPGCGSTCGAVTAAVTVDPTESAAPGQVISLDASTSTVDRCIGGVLQYQFWLDADRSGDVNPAVDVLLRDWTQNDTLVDTPQGDATYLIGVRCATAPTCLDVVSTTVNVNCPTSGGTLGPASGNANPFLDRAPLTRRNVVFVDADTLSWPSATTVDWVRGDLDLLRTQIAGANPYENTVDLCLVNNGVDQSTLVDATEPAPGNAFYYLGRSGASCNLAAGGSYGLVGGTDPISLLRDFGVNGDADACPN